MPAPIEAKIRREIVERHQIGETLISISKELGMSYNTVKKIWSHWRKRGTITPSYEKAKEQGTRRYHSAYKLAIEMKEKHPKWGALLIRLKLEEDLSELPSVRTLQRWFREAGVGQSPKVKQTEVKYVKRGRDVHQVWAVDAKERMQLADGTSACWLVVTDEASGAILEARVFPPVALDES